MIAKKERVKRSFCCYHKFQNIAQYLDLRCMALQLNKVLAWVALLIFMLCASPAKAQVDIKRVLVLHSYHKGLGWTDSITEGIEAAFKNAKFPIEIFYEFMDTKRIFDEAYLAELAKLYQYKYRKRRFDAIISSDDHAFRFLLAHHEALFPQTPVVFCGVNYFKDDFIAGTDYFTGVVESFSIKGTIDGALAIDPEIRRIYAVVDQTVTGQANCKLLDAVIPKYAGRLQFKYITDKDMSQVQEAVSRLPDKSVVLLLSYTSDRSGNTFSLEQSAELVCSASNRPVFGFWDFYLNHGIVGGMLTTGIAHGSEAAKMALRIMDGEKPTDIPVLKESPNRYIYDYAQMQKFGISPEQLPAGSVVINRPLTFYRQYRTLVWQVTIAFGVSLIFSGILAFNLFRRRTAEAMLIKSEDKFRALVETTSDWIWEVDKQGRYTYVSPKVKDLLGYDPAEVVGKTFFDLMTPEEARRVTPILEQTVTDEAPVEQLIHVIPHKQGREVILETTGVPFRDEEGRLAGYRGIGRDITSRHHAEAALQESEARFRDMAELLPETIFETNLDGNLTYANKSGFNQFQITPGDLEKGLNIDAIIEPSDHARLKKNISRILSGEDLGLNEYTALRRDGSRFPVMARSATILKEGRPAGLRGFLIDISDRKRLEEQFQQAQRMESIGTLAGGIAHDFNNLLMGIHGRIQLLQQGTDPSATQMKHLQSIVDHVRSASRLTSQLLGFARAGKYDPKATDLNSLIGKTVDMFGRTRKELRMRQKLAGDLMSAVVDRTQIEQVLLNLFVNAWQAMPEGGDITVETRNATLLEKEERLYNLVPGDYAAITVSDTGEGMDAKTQERIFEPFYTTKPRGRGTGLGLASAYGIIRNHNGAIHVTSSPGHGSAFTILLPAVEGEVESDIAPVQEIRLGTETILLVDDEEMILAVATDLLEALGYRVITAKGGLAAQSSYAEKMKEIDLVLLDLIMPDQSGKETFAQLKAMNPQVRVLLSSGYSLDGEAAAIMQQGCKGFIQKPFDLEQLSNKIREVLKHPVGV
jgi:two-component system, cell cycle sensor histidine kinase and response regulator CckA